MPQTSTAGGITITIMDDGTTEVTYPDGSRSLTYPDGTRIDVSADGKHWTISKDGDSMEIVWDDGSSGDSGDSGGSDDNGDDDSGGDDSGGEDGSDDGNAEMPRDDDQGGAQSDTGWHPRFYGWGDTKDVFDIADTGRTTHIHGTGDDGSGGDAWDRTDTRKTVRLHGGDMVVEPWEKVGPKFRPTFGGKKAAGQLTHFTFNAPALARFIQTVIRLSQSAEGKRGRR